MIKWVLRKIFKNLALIPFIMFSYGGMYFVIGDMEGITSYQIIGGSVAVLGLITFPLANMLVDAVFGEREEDENYS